MNEITDELRKEIYYEVEKQIVILKGVYEKNPELQVVQKNVLEFIDRYNVNILNDLLEIMDGSYMECTDSVCDDEECQLYYRFIMFIFNEHPESFTEEMGEYLSKRTKSGYYKKNN